LSGDPDQCPHRHDSRRVSADLADRGGRICATLQQHATCVEQGLLGGLAYDLVAALQADIEATMPALAAPIERRRRDYDDFCHRARALRDDNRELAQSAEPV